MTSIPHSPCRAAYTTLDFNNLQLPHTIKNPNPDFSGKSPEAPTLIIDPDEVPYGKQIAAGSSFDHEFTLTITSVRNNVIKGTFNGGGHGQFENGEFSAKLPMKDWSCAFCHATFQWTTFRPPYI